MENWTLEDFVRESNRIERIKRAANDPQFQVEVEAHRHFLCQTPTVGELAQFVGTVTALSTRPGVLRSAPGIKLRLEALLEDRVNSDADAHATHLAYENLHPFTDGNGRSGRVLWLHQVGGSAPLGFLHHFYYQTLEAAACGRRRPL